MAVDGIPVYLGRDYRQLVSRARIEDGALRFDIRDVQLIDEFERLATLDDILGVTIDLSYRPAEPLVPVLAGTSTKELLIGDLKQVIDETGRAIDRIKRDNPDTDDWYRLRYHNGDYILAGILSSRAQALVALAHLTA